MKRKAFKAAFPYTLPILAGFSFLGMAYGIYMNASGFSFVYNPKSHVRYALSHLHECIRVFFCLPSLHEFSDLRWLFGVCRCRDAAKSICPGTGIDHGITDPGTPSFLRDFHAGQI